jgi:hypothetical protein
VTDRLDGWGVATRAVGVALIGSAVVLGATGVPLIWRYAPPAHGGLRGAHVVAAVVFLGGGIALLVVTFLRRVMVSRRTPRGWLAGMTAVAAGAFGIVTGRMIAWDWLAVWAVTVPSGDRRGVLRAASSEQVRFVIVDGAEVTPGTYRFWMVLHLLLLALLAVCVALSVRLSPVETVTRATVSTDETR